MNKYTFFYGGILSQWYPSEFEIDGVTYCTAEQYMMAGKARVFEDEATLAEILETSDPWQQKKLGRKITPFDVDTWNENSRDVVYEGSYAKYMQNEILKIYLLGTKDTILVEASPKDRLWGIGLAEDDPRCEDKSKWRGVNWLGEVLTKVREDIKNEVHTTENFGWSDNIHAYKEMPPL